MGESPSTGRVEKRVFSINSADFFKEVQSDCVIAQSMVTSTNDCDDCFQAITKQHVLRDFFLKISKIRMIV